MYIDAQMVQVKEAINRMNGEDGWTRNTALRTRGKEGERERQRCESDGAAGGISSVKAREGVAVLD